MLATVLRGVKDVRLESAPEPRVLTPSDVVVRVVAACVCGSDLWRYWGVKPVVDGFRMGHEFVGIVEEAGSEVAAVRTGQFVIAPFFSSDGTCRRCQDGVQTSCDRLTWWGGADPEGLRVDGGQGELVRVPMADGTLLGLDEEPDADLLPSVLTLTDVMATGHHAAVSAGVGPGSTVAVIGDGAVGLCGVLAASRLGAERIIAMSRYPDRQALALEFGATEIVAERGPDGVALVRELTGGAGVDSALECVGTEQSLTQAVDVARPGGRVGFVGVPATAPAVPIERMFYQNISLAGGVAPVTRYLPSLLPDVLSGAVQPGKVFTHTMPLSQVAQAYAAMDERRAVKVMLRP